MNISVRLLVSCMVFSCMFLVLCQTVFAKKYTEVDVKTVRAMMEQGTPLVVFPLSRIEFNDSHIKGSVNIPLAQLEEKLPADKNRALVFYCLGMRCTASWRAADLAVELGYKDVYAFRGGLPEWVAAGYPTKKIEALPHVDVKGVTTYQLQSMINSNEDLTVLDTCLDVDANKFHIGSPKRIHIPLDDLNDRIGEISRDKKIVVVCLKGKRSPTVVRYLSGKGYKDIYQLEGGMEKWIMDGLPVATNN